ncbi:hypothetical protein DPMN_176569 [Dreissena polymorpha]|uniref:Uncharacterized protein n=1 Tax=Dreissena polymorpha TaxID=45954 RepID=A0A9D4E8I6_DREPO|nr:hypothetical protein DPMN_176569 [Dreissena polymorpha]
MFESAESILNKILRGEANDRLPEASRPDYENLVRNCNRRRQRKRPNDPTDMDFEVIIRNV